MKQNHIINNNRNSHRINTNIKLYKIHLEDLQQYFHYNIFYFDEYYDSEDYDETFSEQYEDQVVDFLRSIGAMVSVDTFFSISDEMVYVRKITEEIIPVKG